MLRKVISPRLQSIQSPQLSCSSKYLIWSSVSSQAVYCDVLYLLIIGILSSLHHCEIWSHFDEDKSHFLPNDSRVPKHYILVVPSAIQGHGNSAKPQSFKFMCNLFKAHMQISQPSRLEVLVMLDLIIVQIIKSQFYLRHFEKLYWYQTVPSYKILSVKSCQKMVTDQPVCLLL